MNLLIEKLVLKLLQNKVYAPMFVMHPRTVIFLSMLTLFFPLSYMFAGLFLGNGWFVVLSLAAVVAAIYTAMQLKTGASLSMFRESGNDE